MATAQDISTQEYVDLKATCDSLKQKMDTASSDMAYQAYKEAWECLSKRYAKATTVITTIERREARKESAQRRKGKRNVSA